LKGDPLIELGGHRIETPAICASVVEGDVNAMAARAAKAVEQGADIVELRVDFLRNLEGWKKLLSGDVPLILTNRTEREGGRFKGEEQARVNYLLEGIAEGVACVDIELSTPPQLLEEVRATAKKHGTSLLISHHDFTGTPSVNILLDIAKRIENAGCDVAKVITFAKTPRDALTVLDFLAQAPDSIAAPVIAFAMGEAGRLSRIASPLFGSPIVYAAADERAAPGQFNIAMTKRLLHELGLRKTP
jgi:3-dehydroquinate dehydratase-1